MKFIIVSLCGAVGMAAVLALPVSAQCTISNNSGDDPLYMCNSNTTSTTTINISTGGTVRSRIRSRINTGNTVIAGEDMVNVNVTSGHASSSISSMISVGNIFLSWPFPIFPF